MKYTQIISFFLIIAPAIGVASSIEVGDSVIEIPAPLGFVLVTPEMTQVNELHKHFIPPTNQQFAAFIAESDVPEALAGEIPPLQRRFTVQTAKNLVNKSVTQAEFAQFKSSIASDIEKTIEEVKKKLPELMSKVSEGISGQLDVQLMMEIGDVVPFSPHYEDDRSISLSMITRNEIRSETGETFSNVIAITMTFIHVRDRVLFIYSYGGKDDLDWTRKSSKEWVRVIVSANPDSRSAIVPKHRSNSSHGGISWDNVTSKAIGGVFLGLVIAFVSWLIIRRKRS